MVFFLINIFFLKIIRAFLSNKSNQITVDFVHLPKVLLFSIFILLSVHVVSCHRWSKNKLQVIVGTVCVIAVIILLLVQYLHFLLNFITLLVYQVAFGMGINKPDGYYYISTILPVLSLCSDVYFCNYR